MTRKQAISRAALDVRLRRYGSWYQVEEPCDALRPHGPATLTSFRRRAEAVEYRARACASYALVLLGMSYIGADRAVAAAIAKGHRRSRELMTAAAKWAREDASRRICTRTKGEEKR